MSQPIWYDSTEAGAPSLNKTPGSLLEVLRACLINGFGSKAVTSIAVTGGVATATCAAHGFTSRRGKLVLISGAGPVELNGRKQPLAADTNSFTFAADGVADGTYTGTISAKRAPLGWTEPHTGTNVAMFARSAPEATSVLLRVDDSEVAPASVTNARVTMIETAAGVDSFTDAAPTSAQLSGGQFWYKGAASIPTVPWAVFGDGLLFYIVLPAVNGTIGQGGFAIHGFGDIVSAFSPDPFGCMLAGSSNDVATGTVATSLGNAGSLPNDVGANALVLSRSADTLTRSIRCGLAGANHVTGVMGSANSPARTDVFMVVGPPVIAEGSNGVARGFVPGIYWPLARTPFTPQGQFAAVTGVLGSDKHFVSVLHLVGSTNGNLLIDVSGPWR